jgi:hypothetical protein
MARRPLDIDAAVVGAYWRECEEVVERGYAGFVPGTPARRAHPVHPTRPTYPTHPESRH